MNAYKKTFQKEELKIVDQGTGEKDQLAINEVKDQVKGGEHLCCLIIKKNKRLSEYKYRLEAWAENYKETARTRINFFNTQLGYLKKLWDKSDNWDKWEACPHKEQHDGNGNYTQSQEVDIILSRINF